MPVTLAGFSAFSDWVHPAFGSQERAGVANQPTDANTTANANPDTDSLGVTLSVITIVILLAKRPARPVVVTPMPDAGSGRWLVLMNCLVCNSASA